ncbi:YolD-like family protein [Paenibacillus sp. UASWS1643]|uniref:YolD-like family protein n=1 Tax=Paenibacillus sp. UASWS1643 TaxID=2580422 RepID=UPI00123B8450|nr:YolD-like family protein [Paenibacillus sp. UASWS1643]KAA8750080.1 YolD-like family protein [Paenibacillus sp. UASWS1643]
MSSKLAGNGLFESSRMILPEHREAWLEHQAKALEKEKPILDEQEMQLIQGAINDSFHQRLRIQITEFDPIEDKMYEGVVSVVNTVRMEIKLVFPDKDWKYIKIADIMSATT